MKGSDKLSIRDPDKRKKPIQLSTAILKFQDKPLICILMYYTQLDKKIKEKLNIGN